MWQYTVALPSSYPAIRNTLNIRDVRPLTFTNQRHHQIHRRLRSKRPIADDSKAESNDDFSPEMVAGRPTRSDEEAAYSIDAIVERDTLLTRVGEEGEGEGEEEGGFVRRGGVNTALLFLFPALAGLLFGYDIGASSGALLSLTDAKMSGTDWSTAMTPFESGLFVSLSLAGALVGSAFTFLIGGDRLGRRQELILASGLYGVGALLAATAPNLGVALLGRGTYGLGIACAMHAAPAYIAETCPPEVRGLLISLKEAFIVGGILAGYAVGALTIDLVGGWRWMFGAAIPVALILGGGMAWLPESPRWLLLPLKLGPESSGANQRRATEAVHALKRIRGELPGRSVELELEDIRRSASLPTEDSDLMRNLSKYRKPLTVGLSLMLFQQITGQPSVLYYAGKIFQDAGFESAGAATSVSVILGVCKLVMTGVAVVTVDSWGRRPLLLGGVSGIVFSLLALWWSSNGADVTSDVAAWTSVAGLLAYVSAYQLSFGPISWLIVGEVFPLTVRGQAIALATLTNFGSNFVVSLVLPTLRDTVGPANLYLIFACIAGVALFTIYTNVPETKGRSLEEIEAMWK